MPLRRSSNQACWLDAKMEAFRVGFLGERRRVVDDGYSKQAWSFFSMRETRMDALGEVVHSALGSREMPGWRLARLCCSY